MTLEEQGKRRRRILEAIAIYGGMLLVFGLMFAVMFCDKAEPGEIPPFTITVPSREHACGSDTTTRDIDYDRVTIVAEARSWRSYVLTFPNVPRDSAVTVHFRDVGFGWYRESHRASEPDLIGCWSDPVGMIAVTPPPVLPPPPPPFPRTPVLDDLGRAALIDATHGWGVGGAAAIQSGALAIATDATLVWPAVFGTDQEVYARAANGLWPSQLILFLKVQGPLTAATAYLDVFYANGALTVETYSGTAWTVRGVVPRVLVSGDQLGARARASGVVDLWVNGALVGSVNISGWPQFALGGRIGIGWFGNPGFRADDFGGGTP